MIALDEGRLATSTNSVTARRSTQTMVADPLWVYSFAPQRLVTDL